MKYFKVTLWRTLVFLDYTLGWTVGEVLMRPGVYRVTQIPNPSIKDGMDWYVFEGTTIGATIQHFRNNTQVEEENIGG